MSIYKITYGVPEQHVPSRYAPLAQEDVSILSPEQVAEIDFSVNRRGCLLEMPLNADAQVYGFGLQLKGFNHKGTKKYIRSNSDALSNSGDSHAPVPFMVTTDGWGIYVDTARYATFYCGYYKRPQSKSEAVEAVDSAVEANTDSLYRVRETNQTGLLTIEIPEVEGVDIYLFTGDTITDIVSQYNRLSGGGCMPALWGLGNIYRCFLEFNQDQVLAFAKEFREKALPCDIIGLEPGWQTCYYPCSYVWNPGRYPDPCAMIGELKEQGFKVNLWEQLFVHNQSPIYEDILPYCGDYLVWNGVVPDFAIPEAQKLFADQQRKLCEMGVTGFKLDECDGSDFTGSWSYPNCSQFPSGMDGEQYHNVVGNLVAQALLSAMGNNRTLSSIRCMGSFAASYPFVLYSDLYDQRDFLRGVVNSGFSGILWTPEVRDAGSKEELLRRIQMTIFSAQSLINGWYLDHMPWKDHDCEAEVKRLLELRMSLIPYLYTAFYDYHTTGKAPVRAVVSDYSNDPETYGLEDEYLFGDAMLVAPIMSDQTEREVYLPAGEWYGFFDHQKYVGGQKYTIVTEDIPVFVKAGTLLSLAKPEQYIAADTCFQITLTEYGDTSAASCRLIEDDGLTYTTDYRVLTVDQTTQSVDSRRYQIVGHEKV